MVTRCARTLTAVAAIVGAVTFMAALAAPQNPPSKVPGLYHPDPQHLWNRLHRHLHVRTTVDGPEFGLDEVDPLLWDETRHLLTGPSHVRAITLLDEFLNTHGERLIADPQKRAVLQHDLWAVFDWAAAQRFHGAHELERRALSTRLARVMRRVALTRDQIGRLPDAYSAAVRADPSLPGDLFSASGSWIALAGFAPIARKHASELSRSVFSVHWSVPGGAPATTAYLKRLWEFAEPFVADGSVDGELRAAINKALPPPPHGTRLALVRTMLLIDQAGRIVPSRVVESVQFHTIDRVHTFSEHTMRRERLFAGQAGGLRAVAADARSFITFSAKGDDPFEQGRRVLRGDPTLSGCDNCHNSRYRPALESILSVQAILKPESLVDTHHPRWAQSFTASWAAASAKGSRVEWGILLGIWQSVPR